MRVLVKNYQKVSDELAAEINFNEPSFPVAYPTKNRCDLTKWQIFDHGAGAFYVSDHYGEIGRLTLTTAGPTGDRYVYVFSQPFTLEDDAFVFELTDTGEHIWEGKVRKATWWKKMSTQQKSLIIGAGLVGVVGLAYYVTR